MSYSANENTFWLTSKEGCDHDEVKTEKSGSGIYFNTCLTCKERFMGYKSRRVCKACDEVTV